MPAIFEEIKKTYTQPLNDLLFKAHGIHRQHHNPNQIELAKLLSIKTGACPEDCGYCAQSGHYKVGLEKESLLTLERVKAEAIKAKEAGATRFCMGAAWRSPPKKDLEKLGLMIKTVKELGLETCMTLGMLDPEKAQSLKAAGLDFYNHNIDTAPSYYNKVVSTRCFQDRLDTLDAVRSAGISVCCGGILGLGETQDDRIEFLMTLANLDPYPESVPINKLIPVQGTPLGQTPEIDNIEIIRTIATARIFMPKAKIRLTAGRLSMSAELQALCYFAGANSIFVGDKLLTKANPSVSDDRQLLDQLGLEVAHF